MDNASLEIIFYLCCWNICKDVITSGDVTAFSNSLLFIPAGSAICLSLLEFAISPKSMGISVTVTYGVAET